MKNLHEIISSLMNKSNASFTDFDNAFSNTINTYDTLIFMASWISNKAHDFNITNPYMGVKYTKNKCTFLLQEAHVSIDFCYYEIMGHNPNNRLIHVIDKNQMIILYDGRLSGLHLVQGMGLDGSSVNLARLNVELNTYFAATCYEIYKRFSCKED